MKTRASGVLPIIALGILGLTVLSAWAGKPPRYHYGDAWWHEYLSDHKTNLLLHFGRPTVTPRLKLVKAIEQKKDEEKLGDLEEIDEIGASAGLGVRLKPEDLTLPPVDDKAVPVGRVLDYSNKRQKWELEGGLKTGPGGRFGEGLHCSGDGGLKVQIGAPKSVECWFKVDAYPKETACLLSMAKDESRVLLHPDGRLEFKLKEPHGLPGKNPNLRETMSPEVLAMIMAKNADIISPKPVPVGEWVHVVVFNKPHPTPGGGEPFDARLKVNGFDVAWYLSERYNDYQYFLGRRDSELVIGNNSTMDQGFTGVIDEVRACSGVRVHYERPVLKWRDAKLKRPLQFDKPYVRENGTVFHASLNEGGKYDLDRGGVGGIKIDLMGQTEDDLGIPGVRGQGWVVDPPIGFPRFPLKGMSAEAGSLEWWLRPVNWDDVTGYWHHTPPVHRNLTVARLYGRDRRSGETVPFLSVSLPRAWNLERSRVPVDAGHWLHLTAVWSKGGKGAAVYINGKRQGGAWRAAAKLLANLEPLYAEFGVRDKVTVKNNEEPRVEIDEVVGYNWPLRADEVTQARQRWMRRLEPIKLYNDSLHFKYALQRLEWSVIPLLPAGIVANACTVALHNMDQGGKAVLGPFDKTIEKGRAFFRLSDGPELPFANYELRFQLKDAAGRAVLTAKREWEYKAEPWRHFRGGILSETPAPWTPIKATRTSVETRMTRYTLGDDGLPREVHANGVNLLAGPFQFFEDNTPIPGRLLEMEPSKNVEVNWRSVFEGKSLDIEMQCRAEYDGMVRYELALKPKRKLGRVSLRIPIRGELAKRYLFYPMGARGVSTGVIGQGADGLVLESRVPKAPYATWRAFTRERKKKPKLTWDKYWGPIKANTKKYGFFGHLDINDMNRGLFWFSDNAAGWHQSKTISAIEIQRRGETVWLVLNLVAEPVEYKSERPIVFGILPHPARPLPTKYRLFERVSAKVDRKACSVFDAFRPWPMDPKASSMKLFPASDPKDPENGPSWEYAESCIDNMRATKPSGYRTMYLSKAWFSCRAGAYDGWEWRSGKSSAVSLTPYFVNYLCWEMNEWVGRGIWEAIYLDEAYEHPASNLEAGFSVRLPDGSEQSGVTNFQFRALMKRWRNLFTAHGKKPMLLAHHTHSWQYQGLVFCDGYLDGENSPIVSLNGRDWIGSTSKHRFEVIQNARLWGTTPFYMPFIAEGGFAEKQKSNFPRWQWRMARQAQSQFAHYETATTYSGQGAQVYKAFWNDAYSWGAGDSKVPFHPYWDNAKFLEVEGQGGDTLVSFYHQPGKVLLIASNRRKTKTIARIKLNMKALGLGTAAKATEHDSSFDGPNAADYLGAGNVKGESAELLKKAGNVLEPGADFADLGDDEVEGILEDPDELKAQERATWHPQLEGSTLTLPIRPRDFRLITIE